MPYIKICVCGSAPVWVKSRGRGIIACPNKDCRMNICNYHSLTEAAKHWNEEVERFGNTGKRN